MDKEELKNRTKKFALRVIKMATCLPKTQTAKIIASQIVRSATSVGANYRAACMARSKAEFVSKLRIVVEEVDECCYWLEIIVESKMMTKKQIDDLYKESGELTAIFISTLKTLNTKKS
jgi:four helix bundle protein